MSNIKYIKSQRLRQFVESLGFSQADFAKQSGIDRGLVNKMYQDKQDVSKATIEKLIEWQPDTNIEWLMTGTGEMRKTKLTEKNMSPCGESIEPGEAYFFASNLRALMADGQVSEDNLASLIGTEHATLTQLLDGDVGPNLRILIRLRAALGIGIDDMLFEDFTLPGAMEHVKQHSENTRKIRELEKRQAEMLKRLEAIEKKTKKQKREEDG